MFWTFLASDLASHGRAVVPTDTAYEALWIVEAIRATPLDETRSLSPAVAVERLAACVVDLPRGVRNALQIGHLLLVAEPVHVGLDAPMGSDAIPLRDLSTEPLEEDGRHEIEVLVVNELGDPVVDLAYALTLPDGETRTGRTNAAGLLRYTGLHQSGDCSLTFPDLEEADQEAA